MNTISKILTIVLLVFLGCKEKRQEPNFYKNLYTQEILNKAEFEEFFRTLHRQYFDSIKGSPCISFHHEKLIQIEDSIIQPFKYDVRIGNEYKIRVNSYEKLGMNISPKTFLSLCGDSIQIGGNQLKPTLINLWFIGCRGCVAEIPALNRLQEKYANKVNFIALTPDKEKDVLKFLKRKGFNFKHIPEVRNFIEQIGSKPYPENIFIDRTGKIKYIEGGIGHNENLDLVIKHFESLIEELLLPTKAKFHGR